MTEKQIYPLLDGINSPKDLKKLDPAQLPELAKDVREYIIDTISKTGGHFGAGLGIVELTVALHYIYNTPEDKIVLDTGHQGYPHKVLTGRKHELPTIRQKDGLSGFLKRTESEYDVFGAGHASTSISAALGLATARDLLGKSNRVIGIIGDGAMTGGLAYEALNNCGYQQRDITVILNDNNYSISPNVSAFSNYFNQIYASNTVQKLRNDFWDIAGKIEPIGDRLRKFAGRVEEGLKAVITPGVLFESLGFNYFGPINGNSIPKLLRVLNVIKDLKGPVFLHIVTQKGYGFEHATEDKGFMHAIGKMDKVTGKTIKSPVAKPSPPKYQDVFGKELLEIIKTNDKVVGITAAMPTGTGLDIVQEERPDKVFDVGIAEGHGVTFAAGLACEGIIPVVAIYSTFLQRAYDHIVHDVAIQHLHVIFALDRAGVVGADGPTHHGVLDLAYMRSIQTMVVMAPKDEQELRDMLRTAVYSVKGPVSIRYPRGEGLGVELRKPELLEIGSWEILREGDDGCIFAIGNMVAYALEAAEKLSEDGFNITVVNARFVKPLDIEILKELSTKFNHAVSIEDGQKQGGMGSAILEGISEHGLDLGITLMGYDDDFVDHASQSQIHKEYGLDASGIISVFSSIKNQKIETFA
ncbi:MAG: 1-deoxy-D-xylulose-5-phosphate synthase [Candidatus Kapaibacteriales bacterium]